MNNWRQILAWQVQTEYSYEEMTMMLERGQIWEALHSSGYRFLYVGDPTIIKEQDSQELGVGISIPRGIWGAGSTERITDDELMNCCIWKREEPFELLDQSWLPETTSSIKFS